MLAELRRAARALVRAPTVTIAAILCLALGIGATVSVSSAIERALLRALPFRAPDRLVAVLRTTPQSGPLGTWPFSVANYIDLRTRMRALAGLEAITTGNGVVNLTSDAERVSEAYATGGVFRLLGVRAQRGRLLMPGDDSAGAPAVAVVSDRFWRGALGGDPAIVGRVLRIDGKPTTIVGVAPPDFRVPQGTQLLQGDIWEPLGFTPEQLAQRRSNFLFLVGRLAPGATPASAQRDLLSVFAGIVAEHPELQGESLRVAAMHAESVRNIRTPLLLLGGAVLLVLLIAATNVASLLLARGIERRREMAVRSAIGASRWDVMRPVLTETLLIALAGTVLGLLLAIVGVRSIGALAAARIPQLAGLGLDGAVLTFAVVLAVVVAALCGIVPAWRGASADPQDALRGGRGGGAGREQHRALGALVVVEIAMSVVLLVGAGLVLEAFAGLLHRDPGFETAHVLTMQVTVDPQRYDHRSTIGAFLEPALREIDALPGVTAAGAINLIPYLGWGNNSNIRYEGTPPDEPTRMPLAEFRAASPGFFAVTGQRLLGGRLLRASDDSAAPPVVVVNEALQKRDFPGRSAVGGRFYIGDSSFATIVGVVSDIRNVGPVSDPAPEMYWSWRQCCGHNSSFGVMVRTAAAPASVAGAARAALRRLDPTVAIAGVRPMDDVIANSLGAPRFYLALLGTFAAVALLLTLAGLYGVLSYAVAQRRRELGIRLALGSPAAGLVRLVTRDGMVLVAIGLALGLAGGAAVTRFMTFMLYGVSPLDARAWGVAVVLMLLAGLAATLLPAIRAARVDPLVAMQAE